MLCYSGKNTELSSCFLHQLSWETTPAWCAARWCLGIVWNRQLSGIMVTTPSCSVQYKVHEKNKCIEMNHL